MKARDVMTSAVVSVAPDTPAREIAKLLRDRGIGAVPVVDAAGVPSGMVSADDLLGRDDAGDKAHDIMAAPVVTVGEATEIGEIARLLTAHSINQVPVLRDGRVVGIVSRADLVRALAAKEPRPAAAGEGGLLAEAFAELDHIFLHRQPPAEPAGPVEPPAAPDETAPTVSDFHGLMADHEHKKLEHRQELRRATAEQRRDRVAELTDHHISDENWQALLHRARQSAESGEKEFMLLRFPSQLCSDGGRAINITAPNWLETLRGEAAELYLRWQRDLKPHGFAFGARLLDFPGGMPGDIGLFIAWGQQ